MSFKNAVVSFIFLFVVGTSAIFSQTIGVNPSQITVGEGEVFSVTFSLENFDFDNFNAPDFSPFTVVGGPNKSSNFSFVNGKTSRSTTFNYQLQATATIGNYTLGAAKAIKGKKQYFSAKIPVTVVKGNPSKRKPSNQGNATIGAGGDSGNNIFFRLETDTNQVYVGQQLLVNYVLYTQSDIVDYGMQTAPTFNNSWAENISPKQASVQSVVVNGENYQKVILQQYAVFPQMSGKLDIPAATVETILRIADRSFGGFLRYRNTNRSFTSEPIQVNVIPLPDAGKPANFSGLVGDLSSSITLSNTELKAGEAFYITLAYNGYGNLKLAETPQLSLDKDAFKVLDPEVTEQYRSINGKMGGSKVFKFPVVPQKEGKFALAPHTLNYFSVNEGKYKMLSPQNFIVNVAPPDPNALSNALTFQDIIVSGSLKPVADTPLKKPWFWALAVFPFLFLGGAIFRHEQKQKPVDKTALKQAKALEEAQKSLQEAGKYLQENNFSSYYPALSKALWGFPTDKWNIAPSDLTKENIGDKLSKLPNGTNLFAQWQELIQDCEQALYAPNLHNAADAQKKYQTALNWMTEVGKVV
ncbi:MAG: BatD family protein [Chitinophagales bacterium]|nr:protein BatD [Bacteroidota bacterium]MCB9043243.1 protein BatD [Chitinophagales bacterium]